MNSNRRPADRLIAGFLFDNVGSSSSVLSLQLSRELSLQRLLPDHMVWERAGQTHDLFVVLPLMEHYQIFTFQRSQNDKHSGEQDHQSMFCFPSSNKMRHSRREAPSMKDSS